MKFHQLTPRKYWQDIVEAQGFNFHSHDEGLYWAEDRCYEFTKNEVLAFEKTANEIHQMCFEAVDFVISTNRFKDLAIPQDCIEVIKRSWEQEQPSVYGRFDFSYDNISPPKLLEYNADTPTTLLETAVIQAHWLEDRRLELGGVQVDQFNFLHETMVGFWKWYNKTIIKDPSEVVYFSCISDVAEDLQTVEYMRDCAAHADLSTDIIFLEDIGWTGEQFVDLQDNPIEHLFKLHPWEILYHEPFGKHLLKPCIKVLEPPWKMILSNKGLLPILWEMYEGHPNLLPAYFEPGKIEGAFVKKPIYSREGANVTVVDNSQSFSTEGIYGAEGHIYQKYHPLHKFEGGHAMIGLWVVGEQACALGVRESDRLVTDNRSRFVPHFFR